MFLKKLYNVHKTLSFRLTLWYTILFSISSFLAFSIFFFVITSIMTQQIDEELIDDVDEYLQMLSIKGISEVKQEIIQEAETDGVEKIFFRIFDREGRIVGQSNMSLWRVTGDQVTALNVIHSGVDYYFEDLVDDDREYTSRTIYGRINSDLILQIGMTLEERDQFLVLVQIIFGITLVIVIGLAAFLGFFFNALVTCRCKRSYQRGFGHFKKWESRSACVAETSR